MKKSRAKKDRLRAWIGDWLPSEQEWWRIKKQQFLEALLLDEPKTP